MAMFALITRDLTTILKKRENVTPVPKEQLDPAKPYWVPYNDIHNDTSITDEKVYEDAVETIYVDRVERVFTTRDMTPQELDAQDTAVVTKLGSVNGIDRAQFQLLFRLANQVRVLEGKPEIDVPQFKDYIKGLMRP